MVRSVRLFGAVGRRNPGRKRQPSGARERWKPEWGETPQVARCKHDSATGHVSWPGTPEFQGSMSTTPWTNLMPQASGSSALLMELLVYGRAGAAGSAVLRSAKHRAAGIASRLSPEDKRSAQARRAGGVRDQSRMAATRHEARGVAREPNAGTAVVHKATRKRIRCAANKGFMSNIRYSAVIR